MRGFYLFSLKNVPVFVSGWYLILMAYLFMTSGIRSHGLVFIGVATLGILVHEFGHALVARKWDLQPSIILHGWGGLCAHRPAKRDAHKAAITAAGPGAGLILGLASLVTQSIIITQSPDWLSQRPLIAVFLTYMIWVNIGWSILNLIPLWPLDGGQLISIALKQKLKQKTARQITHGLGVVIGIALLLLGVKFSAFFIIIVAGLLTYTNLAKLKNPQGERSISPSKHAEDIYQRAILAADEHDWEEVARLGHQMRAEGRTTDQIARAWELLTVATTNLERYEEAYRYAQRAPQTDAVIQARKRCEEVLGIEPLDP